MRGAGEDRIENWPRPVKPGPETAALGRFHRDVTWTGKVHAAGETPEMDAAGRGHFRWSADGLWVIGDFFQEQFHNGRKVTEWRAHYIAGWDVARRCYVAFAADSNGRSVPFAGVIEGDSFILSSEGPGAVGAAVRLRMTWDLARPPLVTWRNEMSVDGGPWALIEEYEMLPAEAGPGT